MSDTVNFAAEMRSDHIFTMKEKLKMVGKLSLPGILAQISEIIMQYIDAAMVGVLGAEASASIGLVSSSTWLFGGVVAGAAAGFAVQVAHQAGAGNREKSREIFREALLASLLISVIFGALGAALAFVLPQWLGAEPSLWNDARDYFLWFALFLPARMIQRLLVNMLQCAGNMKTPSVLSAIMCGLDVVFNALLIFPGRIVSFGPVSFYLPGADLGVLGAQLGTSFAIVVVMVILLWWCVRKEPLLKQQGIQGHWLPSKDVMKEALHIGVPMALEQTATTGAQVVSTRIVAPLGTVAIAANSFAVTAESICYMPGYGIGSAATTMVGQAIGARRKDLTRSFAWLTTFTGMIIMTLTGLAMYFLCPYVFAFLTPDPAVQELGVSVLRIELLAEPMFAASIVAAGALRGAGDTLVPGILNLVSIWGVRLTIAYFLAQTMGLPGVWIAMASELTVRGILFLIRLKREKWEL
jgi:putative MATE family efflux protein